MWMKMSDQHLYLAKKQKTTKKQTSPQTDVKVTCAPL